MTLFSFFTGNTWNEKRWVLCSTCLEAEAVEDPSQTVLGCVDIDQCAGLSWTSVSTQSMFQLQAYSYARQPEKLSQSWHIIGNLLSESGIFTRKVNLNSRVSHSFCTVDLKRLPGIILSTMLVKEEKKDTCRQLYHSSKLHSVHKSLHMSFLSSGALRV